MAVGIIDFKLNGSSLPTSGMSIEMVPRDVKKTFEMADGGISIDIKAQKRDFQIKYSAINQTNYDTLWSLWETKAAVTAAYTDQAGTAVSFSAYMSPPIARIRETHTDGTWWLEGVSFTVEEL